jgi:protein-disulfide isomerase
MADEHLKLVNGAGVSGTPTFFVNGTVVIGADTEGIRKAIDKAKK